MTVKCCFQENTPNFEGCNDEDSLSDRIKRLRQGYLLSVLFFCTNAQCCCPFHVQLADVMECCRANLNSESSWSHASLDTLKRHIHSISEKRKQTGIEGLSVSGKRIHCDIR